MNIFSRAKKTKGEPLQIKTSTGRPRVLRILAILLALGVTGFAIHRLTDPDINPAAAMTVSTEAVIELLPRDVAEVTRRELERSIPLTGTVYPLNQTEIKSQQASQIDQVLVRVGEPVRRGQVLARLDTTDLDAKLRDKLGALAVGKAQLAHAQKNLQTNATLRKSNFISENAFDNIKNSFQINEAGLLSLQAQVEQARKALADAVIRSPMDGVIAERVAQPGLAVSVNAKLFTVQDLSVMNVEAAIPANDIPQVQIGQAASLQIEGFSDREFVGRVDRINPSTEKGTRSIIVHLSVANPEGVLKGGMFAQGTLGVSGRIDALVLPLAALRESDGKTTVLRIESGHLIEQPVEAGLQDSASESVEIKSGLPEHALVVVGKMDKLKHGQAVSVSPAGS